VRVSVRVSCALSDRETGRFSASRQLLNRDVMLLSNR